MEEKIIRLEEGQKRLEEGQKQIVARFEHVEVKFDKLETRLENFEIKVENAFETLIREVRITNNTLEGIWNVASEVLKVGSKQRKISEMMSQAYEKAAEELKV